MKYDFEKYNDDIIHMNNRFPVIDAIIDKKMANLHTKGLWISFLLNSFPKLCSGYGQCVFCGYISST